MKKLRTKMNKQSKELRNAHINADKTLEKIEGNINILYNKKSLKIANKTKIIKKMFGKIWNEKLSELNAGKITKQEYEEFMIKNVLLSKQWKKINRSITKEISETNKQAIELANEKMDGIYIDNYNSMIETIVGELKENGDYKLLAKE